jgi:hypothetical protein
MLNAATYLGMSAATVAGWLIGDWRTGLAVAAVLLALLFFVAGWRLQRQLDERPVLHLSFDPKRAYQNGFLEVTTFKPVSRFCCVSVTVQGGRSEFCEARIIGCERREDGGFSRLEKFLGAIELAWPRQPLKRSIDIEADVAEPLVVCIGVEDGDHVFLGTNLGAMGEALRLSHGEYRIKVRVRPTYSSTDATPAEEWFRIKHNGAWDEVELLDDAA